MDEHILRALKERGWGYDSESSSFTHSDIRYPWEDEVNSQGELFYVMHFPFSKDHSEPSQDNVLLNNVDNANDKTNSAGLLGRLMRRRSSSRRSFRRKDDKSCLPRESEPFAISSEDHSHQAAVNKEKLDGELEPINICMKIDFPNMKIIGRRSTAVETFLGLKVAINGYRIIINDVIPNSPAHSTQSAFRKGDWLHSINGILMTPENIENYLRNISFSKEVKEIVLTVQRLKPVVKAVPSISYAINEQEDYEIEGFGALFIRFGRNVEGTSSDDIVYSYPSEENVIITIRGAFLTLLHLLPSLGANGPLSSSVIIKDQLIHVVYIKKDDGVMLIAMPDARISLKELYWVKIDVVRCLLFTFQSLLRCFSERNFNSLDKFFHALFKRIINRQMESQEKIYEFESLLAAVPSLPVPHELYMQVDDALNELEANDVEGFEEHRLFNIIGACYFYKGYNVCSHLGKEDLIDIISLCRQSDILAFMKGGVSDLVFWKEVFPASMHRGVTQFHGPYSLLPASWFLMIVAKDHNFLFVLLESGGYTLRPLEKLGPDVGYVEEALATLKHIMKLGIPIIANKMIKENHEPSSKPNLNNSSSSAEHSLLSSQSESTTTLSKQRSLSFRSLDSCHLARSRSNITVIAASGYESLSSDDCAPVIGRRAERELAMETLSRGSDISDDSDWNKEFKSLNRSSNSEIQETEANITPTITAGNKDVMLHFVQMDKLSGVLISSVNNAKEYSCLLSNFRLYAHQIHNILMNTISFKKLKAPEVSMSTINKSMVAIKEHGILFECDEKKTEFQSYWVVGRIYFTPHLKEVYLCYQDSCPQNMIEVALRIGLSTPN